MKNYAIEVFFNQQFDQYVRDLWRQCDSNHLSSFMSRVRGTEPHIALSVYENVDSAQLETKFNELAAIHLYEIELIFDAVAVFPTSNATFLQPNVKREFNELMTTIHEHFKEFSEQCNMFYRPDRWFPHVTISKNNNLADLKKTASYIIEQFAPQIGRVEKLVLVEIEYLNGEIYCRNLKTKELNPPSI
ncbi:2'-5' RNA ligase family protein [Paenibacillaceae bacterium WGS1546]|uniref:2'-5' RNA ligase family protein n=1 Tax=Cohnella sp. WGS1546 TaxID=3366810 RepID=UPI00372D80B2